MDLLMPLLTARRTYMVRLREGVPREYASSASRRQRRAWRRADPEWSGVRLESAHRRYVGQLQPILMGVTVAAGLVLVVVCANLAVLMVLRTMRRQKKSRSAPRSAPSGVTSRECWSPRACSCARPPSRSG